MSNTPEPKSAAKQPDAQSETDGSKRPDHQISVQNRGDRERRRMRQAMGIALLAHVIVFALWRTGPNLVSPYAAAGPRSGDDRAAAGGAMEALQLQIRQVQPIPTPRVPLLSMEIDPEPLEFEEEPQELSEMLGDMPGSSRDAGEGEAEGPGRAEGTGQGDGGTADEGLFRLMPPTPRGMIMPPTNQALRGKQVEVWVFVGEDGRVVPDSTYLRPPTEDRGFNERLLREAAEWVFRPATKGGRPVAAWFPYTISM